ncbi:MAG: hypothetical protein JST44_13270 [Cyanobacteria bacterium SZAS LIN-5]|nr:hypothetical protein [Cyanobacteria bacterium SZAS LIN-5]RTL36072.1 MAG: hypothetical protein EKK48_27345 [Candidatus Melainabacteria bacterium]
MAETVPTTIDLLSECFSLEAEHLAVLNLACLDANMEPGEYMFRQGKLNPQIVRGAVFCQMYMHEKLLTRSVALKAVKTLSEKDIPIEEALTLVGWDHAYHENIRQLRDLLLASSLISARDNSQALATCVPYQLPYLSALVQRNVVTMETADYLLSMQEKVLLSEVSFEEAVDLLSRCKKPDGKVANPEALRKPVTREIETFKGSRLGELLVASTMITPLQLISAVEEGRRRGKLTGEVLVSQGSLTEGDLKRVLNAQGRIENGSLSFAEAIGKLDPKRALPPP